MVRHGRASDGVVVIVAGCGCAGRSLRAFVSAICGRVSGSRAGIGDAVVVACQDPCGGRRRVLVVVQHESPLSLGGPGVRRWGPCTRLCSIVLSLSLHPEAVEAELAAGRLCCPDCDAPLARWGFTTERAVRTRHGVRRLRPRRARCGPCETTHVLLPGWVVPRRRDCADVIGDALLANAQGEGHRRIATRLGRPPGTVRGWLRAFSRRADAIASCARRWTHAIDPRELQARGPAAGSPVADAVDALGAVTRACRLRLGRRAPPWELAVVLTGGLLHGQPRDPGL